MGDNVFLGDRNGVRTPMQWSPVAVWQSARQPRSERRLRRADNGAYPAQEFVLFDEPRCATIPPSDGGKGGIESGRAEFGDLRPGQAGRPGEKPATRKAIPNRVGDLPPDPRRHQMRDPNNRNRLRPRQSGGAERFDPPIGKLWGDGWLVETPIGRRPVRQADRADRDGLGRRHDGPETSSATDAASFASGASRPSTTSRQRRRSCLSSMSRQIAATI